MPRVSWPHGRAAAMLARRARQPLAAVACAGRAERRRSVWRSTISAAFRSGTPPMRSAPSPTPASLEKQAGFLEGGLDVAAVEILIEARSAAPAPAHRLLQFRRQTADRATRRDWRTAAPGCPARVAAVCAAADTATRSSGVSRSSAAPHVGRRRRRVRRKRFRRQASPARRHRRAAASLAPCPTTASRMPSGVCDTASCKVWPGLQRDLGHHVDRQTGDRDPHQIVGQDLQHLASITLPGCSTRSGATRRPLGGEHRNIGLMEIAMTEVSLERAS